MCLSKSSTIARATSALPFTGAAPAAAEAWSMMLTSTTVSSGPSLSTLTSTFRRLSPSSIRAASTASSSVRPRPSADFISEPSSFWFPGPGSVLGSLRRCTWGFVLSPLRPVARPILRAASAPALGVDGLVRSGTAPLWQQVPPAGHEALLNDTDAVADKPVEPEPCGYCDGEVQDHQGRKQDHRSLHLLGLLLLLGRVRQRWHLQHPRLNQGRDGGKDWEDEVCKCRYGQAGKQQVVVGVVVQVGDEQEGRRHMLVHREVPEYVVESRQYRQLHDQREAADPPSQRGDPVLLVELHGLGVELLPVAFEFLAQVRDLWRELALLDHGFPLGDDVQLLAGGGRQAEGDRHDHDSGEE